MTAFKKPEQIRDDIEDLEELLEKAGQYSQDIFDFVRMVGKVEMLHYQSDFKGAIWLKIKLLKKDLL